MSDPLIESGKTFFLESVKSRYSYNFEWLSRPIIQYPQDIVAFQEIVWKVKPDLVIETGIAHGGSLILSASLLTLLDYCEAKESNLLIDPEKPKRKVVGIDIDIRAHNLKALNAHPLRNCIELIEGSSIDTTVIDKVISHTKNRNCVLVCLDSNHTHDHVFAELSAYAPLVTPGSYCIVFDTVIDDLPDQLSVDRPWNKGNSPKTAVSKFLEMNHQFEIDKSFQEKLVLTVAPDGYLRRIRDQKPNF